MSDGAVVSALMRAANQEREEWCGALARGQVSFPAVISMSKSNEHKALSKMRLLFVLAQKSGWSEATAQAALQHVGIDLKATVQSIRNNPGKVEAFSNLLLATSADWRTRPKMPDGWPWRGKLALLAEQVGAPVPRELVDDAPDTGGDPDDVIARLMGVRE